MTRRYGRASRGERVREGAPAGHWHTQTLLGANQLWTTGATMTIESPTDSDVFLTYVDCRSCVAIAAWAGGRNGQPVGSQEPLLRERIEQAEPACCICHPTRPTSIRSSSAGQNQRILSGRPKLAFSTCLSRRSRRRSPRSQAQNAAAWFHHSAMGYGNYGTALASWKPSYRAWDWHQQPGHAWFLRMEVVRRLQVGNRFCVISPFEISIRGMQVLVESLRVQRHCFCQGVPGRRPGSCDSVAHASQV